MQARWLFNQKKRQSWAGGYVPKLSSDTPIQHVNDRVRQIQGPPKQYQNGKNGTVITNHKDVANEDTAAFTDNSSSTLYSAIFQAIEEQEGTMKTDFTSDNNKIYNKAFRLKDLKPSIMKAKPRAPGPDGIHDYRLKHLTEDRLEIAKRGPIQNIDLCRFFFSVESSNGDPNPQTKQGSYWFTKLLIHCTDQLPMIGSGMHD